MKRHTHIGYSLVLDEVPCGSRVLDLGCGDGLLLKMLVEEKGVEGFGVELSGVGVSMCLEKGLYCYQGDIDDGLADYRDRHFDYVILNQTLQSTKKPEYVIKEVMRISKHAMVSFPNFGHIKSRAQLIITGRMPKNSELPFEWYESPNYHPLTINDFQVYCKKRNYRIEKEAHFSITGGGELKRIDFFANVRAQYGFFVIGGN
jgi:methionine biosynthesis protein MetW